MLTEWIATLAILATVTQPPILPNEYSIVCKTDQSVGFDWNYGWKRTNFKSNTYLITRQDSNKCYGKEIRTLGGADAFFYRGVCLNKREIGGKYFPFSSASCTEYYMERGGEWDISISCYDHDLVAQIDPNGWFHLAFIHGNLKFLPEKNYKDSQYIEIGKCSLAA